MCICFKLILSPGVPSSQKYNNQLTNHHQEHKTIGQSNHKDLTEDQKHQEYLRKQQIKLQQELMRQQQFKQEEFNTNGK